MLKGSWFTSLFLVLMSLFATGAHASGVSEQSLPDYSIAAGRISFVQTKHVQGLPRPLVSRGYLELSTDSLEWVTEAPVANRIMVTADGVHEVKAGQAQRISGSELVAGLLLALLYQDRVYLQQYFRIESSEAHCHTLIPSNEPMSDFYQLIEVCGEQHVEHVQLLEVNGSRTDIQLNSEQD